MTSYNVEITMHNGEKFTVGTWTCKKAEAVRAAKEAYKGHKSYKGIKQ